MNFIIENFPLIVIVLMLILAYAKCGYSLLKIVDINFTQSNCKPCYMFLLVVWPLILLLGDD